jgi:diguanylate cyclase (GGDEF)-like protein
MTLAGADRHMAHDESPTGSTRRGPTIAALIAVFSLLPALAVLASSWSSYHQANDERARSLAAVAATRDVVRLATVSIAVDDEKNWSGAVSTIAALDVPDSTVEVGLPTSPTVALEGAHRRVDDLTAGHDDPALDAAIDKARSASNSRERLWRYEQVLELLADRLGEAQNGQLIAGVQMRGVRDLSDAVAYTRSLNAVMNSYFATRFDVRGTALDEGASLIESIATYDHDLARLRARFVTHPGLERQVEVLSGDIRVTALVDRARALAQSVVTDGVMGQTAPLRLDTVIAEFDHLRSVFAVGELSSMKAPLLIEWVGDRLLGSTAATAATAERDLRNAMLAGGAGLALSALAILFGSAMISSPIRALSLAVRDLRDGEPNMQRTGAAPRGPREVREVFHLLNDTSENLELISQQAHALASGALQAPVLDTTATGGLGGSIQRAVARLREALSQQEAFRRQLVHEASHDGLTQLANRSTSLAHLGQAIARSERSGATVAVLFIDLDRFKEINDTQGHHVGDVVLTTVAERLIDAVRAGDHVGRLGGDEFVVIAEPVATMGAAVELAHRIVEIVAAPIDIGDITVRIGASVGVALSGSGELTADEMLRDADLAVYRVKDSGRGGVEVCDEALRSAVAEFSDLTTALRHALAHNELVLHYQAIVDALGDRTIAHEALVRWRRPDGSLVPPAGFIAHAERTGLIIDLDRWVLNAAIRQLVDWQYDDHMRGIPLSVNVSAQHLVDASFVDDVLAPLAHWHVDPSLLIIEVTESAVLDDLATAATKLECLREHGIAVAIDDFGTGFTSITQLRRLPVDILKIDRAYTSRASLDPKDAAIVKLIIDTGHLLGASITAEGVETLDEATLLSALGSDALQGFLYSRPGPPEVLDRSLAAVPEYATADVAAAPPPRR